VLAENEELRQAQLERLRQHSETHLGPMGPLNAELLAEMNERVEVYTFPLKLLRPAQLCMHSTRRNRRLFWLT
jgi:hypothetical protein